MQENVRMRNFFPVILVSDLDLCLKCVKPQNILLLLLQDKKAYLDVIHTYMEVHGTVHGTSTIYIPGYVKNHGILSGRDLQFLLRETKVSLSRRNSKNR